MTKKIAILPGDGIGKEIVAEAVKIIDVLRLRHGIQLEVEFAPFGGAGYDIAGSPLPPATLKLCELADAVLCGAVGGPRYDLLERTLRPERGLLALRSALGLFANIRPAVLYQELVESSSLKRSVVEGLNMVIVRELTGDIYFGTPRGIVETGGQRIGANTMTYSETEIERVARVGFKLAQKRSKRLCSIDKANVLETSELWREVVTQVASDYPEVSLSHMYVDNAAMQLVKDPRQFDVILTGNMFGDILSDISSMLTGSIGMLPSASLDENDKGLYEPVHGSAPEIAGKGIANPLATILSLALMFRYTFKDEVSAIKIEQAVTCALKNGFRTMDIGGVGKVVGTSAMGDAVADAL
jgi:3-isopropylmalate dehydrogenase